MFTRVYFVPQNMALPAERSTMRSNGYKHFAPSEQGAYWNDNFTILLVNLYSVEQMRRHDFKYRLLLITVAAGIAVSSCSNNDNAHTTAITQIAAPPNQVLTVINRPAPTSTTPPLLDPTADPKKAFLIFHLQNGTKFRAGEEVPIAFAVQNAKLKGDGGEFRVRYIVDDDDMKWLDTSDSFWLSGWTPGKHTVRIELIGPDGWPYKNGNANIVTREITIAP